MQTKKPFRPSRLHSSLSLVMALVFILAAAGCSAIQLPGLGPQSTAGTAGTLEPPKDTPVPIEPLLKAQMDFRVEVPANTPPDTAVILSILDEVTGLALNPENYPMQPEQPEDGSAPRNYSLSLNLAMGSTVKYRYERTADGFTVAEHISDGRPVRYRLYHVEGPGTVEDVVSSWTDTSFDSPTGRIQGQVSDAISGQPLPDLLVTAGGAQSLTASDGSFLLEGLPPGVHNLVAMALDGSYTTFQQGARVAAESTTPADIRMRAAPPVKVVFVVTLPEGTPPVIPVRLAGSLLQTGNTFANLSGGISTLAANMPALSPLPDGRYTLTMTLPVGADLRYKYTLGDGFWNAEHQPGGAFRVRQVVVPDKNVLIEDQVDTWRVGDNGPVTFDLSVPQDTPAGDTVWLQLSPVFGWTEPIPMWQLAPQRWAYVLYSPLNLPGNLYYRYCRNGQCGYADDASTPGEQGAGRPLQIPSEALTVKDRVEAWNGLSAGQETSLDLSVAVKPHSADFMAGIALQPAWDPSWLSLMPGILGDVKRLGANWVVLSPTWTFTRTDPPVLEQVTGQDALWSDLVETIQEAQSQGLQVALQPTPDFMGDPADWWQASKRDFSWWLVWFSHYGTFLRHHAELAARAGLPVLVLGGEWLGPALPGGALSDGSPSGVPADAEARWREILKDVRSRYQGKLYWALPAAQISSPPPFLDVLDGIYLLWTDADQPFGPQADMEAGAARTLDNQARPVQLLHDLPLVLGVSFPSTQGLDQQALAYQALLNVLNERDWISGLVSLGYYPPAALQDASPSVNGKPASKVLSYWFPLLARAP